MSVDEPPLRVLLGGTVFALEAMLCLLVFAPDLRRRLGAQVPLRRLVVGRIG